MAAVTGGLVWAIARVWRGNSNTAFAAATLAVSLACWTAVLAATPPQHRLLELGVGLSAVLALALGGLVWRGVSADKALALYASLGTVLLAVEAVRAPSLEARRRAASARSAAQADGGAGALAHGRRGSDVPVPERDFPFPIDEWVRGRSWPDEDLVYTLEPGGMFKQYYPDNPRGYFYEESAAEWAMRQHWQAQGDRTYFLTPLADDGSGVQVHFRTPHQPREYHPQVSWGRFAVRAGQELAATFRCRTALPRRINVLWQGAHEPWRNVAPDTGVDAGAEWQEFTVRGRADADESSAVLMWVVPPLDAPVDLTDVRVTIDGQPVQPAAVPKLYRHYVSHSMNSRGQRDREYDVPRPDGVFRIVCLGDSYTFGQGVHRQDLLTTVLAQRLNEQADALGDATRYEVINCGACGYGTREERILYERVCRQYQPQLVLTLVVQNDDINCREEQQQLVEAQGRFEVLRALREAASSHSQRDFTRSLVELRTLQAACQSDGAKLAVAVFRHEPVSAGGDWDKLLKVLGPGLEAEKIPWVDLGDALLNRWSFNDMRVYPGGDGHPNELAHRTAAELLENFLRQQRLVPLPP